MPDSIPSPCVAALNRAVKAASAAGSCKGIPLDDPRLAQICKAIHDRPIPKPMLHQFDRQTLCYIFCCCKDQPNVGAGESQQNLRQSCVSQTLGQADQAMGYHSRFKPEISYDMTQNPPAPLMHRDANGQDTTEPTHSWQNRAQQIPDYRSGIGMVRRPDVVIVNDPTKPPTQDNIDQVIEMKFPGDKLGDGQELAYQRIAGSRLKVLVLTSETCNCPNKDEKPLEVPDWLKLIIAALLALLLRRFLPAIPPEGLPGPVPAPAIA